MADAALSTRQRPHTHRATKGHSPRGPSTQSTRVTLPLPVSAGRAALPSALIALLVCPHVVIRGHCREIRNCLSLSPSASLVFLRVANLPLAAGTRAADHRATNPELSETSVGGIGTSGLPSRVDCVTAAFRVRACVSGAGPPSTQSSAVACCIPAVGFENPGGERERQHFCAMMMKSIEHHKPPPLTPQGQREDLSTSIRGRNGTLLTCLDVAKDFLFREYWDVKRDWAGVNLCSWTPSHLPRWRGSPHCCSDQSQQLFSKAAFLAPHT